MSSRDGEKKRKRGRPLKGDRPAKRIGFYVKGESHEWLTALPNRSEWIEEMIEKSRKNSDTSAHNSADFQPPDQDAEK